VGEPRTIRAGPGLLPDPGALELLFDIGKEFVYLNLLQILRVEPFELGAIEDGIGATDAGEAEALDEITGANEFVVISRRPAEERQEIAEGLGEKTFLGRRWWRRGAWKGACGPAPR